MLNTYLETNENRFLKAASLGLVIMAVVCACSYWILSGDDFNLIMAAVVAAGIAFLIAIVSDWRNGLYCFFIWIVFEDLIRKFTGNSLYMFFAKDLLIGLTYASMLIAWKRRRLLTFKPPFLLSFAIFFCFSLLQALNVNAHNVLYGLLGLKTYFYYVPLIFAGYAFLRSEEDLRKFLMLNMWIALFVAGLGVVQSVLGFTFLNPSNLAPELMALGEAVRKSPITDLQVQRVTSVYVSDGRFGEALLLFYVLAWGAIGYLLVENKRGRMVVFPAIGVVALASILNGVRHTFVAIVVTTVLMALALRSGMPRRKHRSFRMGKAIRLAAICTTVAVMLMTFLYPETVRARWAFLSETLTPGGEGSEFGNRGWEYPFRELIKVFDSPNWVLGNGTGTVSLGRQYVDRITGLPGTTWGSENGYGDLILEFGIAGPFLWFMWTGTLMVWEWRTVRKLRGTSLFPVGCAFFWYSAYILILGFFYTLNIYQNYFANAYLWLTVGMLFRLPGLLASRKEKAPANPAYVAATT